MIIYKITNIKNNKSYIGLTTQTLKKRWQQHINTAYSNKSKDRNEVFKKAIRKYGPDNFELKIIDIANSLEELKEKEKFWIKYYNTCYLWENGYGYNGTEGGDSPTQLTTSVLQINILTGQITNEFTSIKEAEKIYGRGIQEIINNQVIGQKPKGYTWIKKEELNNFSKEENYLKYKVFCQLDLNGNFIKLWLNQEDAAKSTQCNRGNIGSCLIHQRQQAGGYQWCYYSELKNKLNKKYHRNKKTKYIAQYDLNNNLINVFSSASEAAEKTKSHISKISNVCNGKRNQTNGYKWKYISKEEYDSCALQEL